MSWAGRRKGLYIGTTSIIMALIIGGIGYLIFSRTPTCTDGIQNGTETGVDCGGACTRICTEDTRAPVVLWNRSFMVASGTYTAAAYIENNNRGAYVREAHYLFQLRDANNNVIAERQGVTALVPGGVTPVVEANIATGNSIPVRTFFTFTDTALKWEKGEAPAVQVIPEPLEVEVRRQTVRVGNLSGRDIEDLPVAVVLFDANGTAVAASKSIIGRLPKAGEETVIFTWPSAFSNTPINSEIKAVSIPR